MPTIAKSELPAYIGKCYVSWMKANIHLKKDEEERLKFYVGGDNQWRPEEINKRKSAQRPIITINRCKPAVDNVEGDIRMNPPGPQCHPVGQGSDGDVADIYEGLIREVEYRSQAKTAYATAAKYAAVSGYAVLELSTEYVNERSFAQQLVINSVEDPAMVFFDPASRMANRQDAAWAGKIKMYSKSEYIANFGLKRKVLQPRNIGATLGWIQQFSGLAGEFSRINEWTNEGEGPFWVVEFYMVESKPTKLRLYSDGITRFDDEYCPEGVTRKEGDQYIRSEGRRIIRKYVVDALEVIDETDWPGCIIPLFPVLGPEIYINGKLHRLSLISGALDSQRALNYTATTAVELVGTLPKSPWIGPEGTFADPRWETANSQIWAYLEYKPVFATSDAGAQQLSPPPQRNQWEAPIQWLLALAAYFADSIKAVTSIYDPSLGVSRAEQSGKALQQLRSESTVANFSYADNLHRAIEVMYGQMLEIFPKIMDGPRTVAIVRPDSQHEMKMINQIFTDKHGNQRNYDISKGQYSVRVIAAPSFETRQDEAIQMVSDFIQKDPAILQAPGVASAVLRLIGQGNPKVESIADLLSPGASEMTPDQMAIKLQGLEQQAQMQNQLIQKMQMALLAKVPEQEAKKWIAAIRVISNIRAAEIKAGVDKAQQELDALDRFTGMAHERAMQSADQAHQAQLAQLQQQHDQQMQAQQQEQQQDQQQEPESEEPAEATQ
jgi:hypothetical protein